uniref:Transposase n=1 Tax=Romanomermis culicivorax TaxID=13658 RepID=A0A915IJN8_ROMCU
MAYKSQLKYVQSTNYKGSMYMMIEILNAKSKMTMHVLTKEDANY